MPDYAWICHSCKASNPSGFDVCTSCGFQAIATGAEIEEAVTGIPHSPSLSRKELLKERRLEMAALPLWKKPIAYLLRGVQIFGSLIFGVGLFELSGIGMLMGLAVTFVAETLYQLLNGRFKYRPVTTKGTLLR